MKKLLTILVGLLTLVPVMATTVDTTWSGSVGWIETKISNTYSYTKVSGGHNSGSGEFHGWDNSYDRVEGWSEASYTGGGEYHFEQWNDLTAGAGGESNIYANTFSADGTGFIDVSGDNWRRGNSLYTHGYSGHGWSGTDSPVVGAESNTGQYSIGISAFWDQDEDGTYESSYSGTIIGDRVNYGEAGIGTWKAGSTTILSSGGNIGGNVLVNGQGVGTWTQSFYNTGTFNGEFHWS